MWVSTSYNRGPNKGKLTACHRLYPESKEIKACLEHAQRTVVERSMDQKRMSTTLLLPREDHTKPVHSVTRDSRHNPAVTEFSVPRNLLTPFRAEGEAELKDLYNFMTVQSDVRVPKRAIKCLEDERSNEAYRSAVFSAVCATNVCALFSNFFSFFFWGRNERKRRLEPSFHAGRAERSARSHARKPVRLAHSLCNRSIRLSNHNCGKMALFGFLLQRRTAGQRCTKGEGAFNSPFFPFISAWINNFHNYFCVACPSGQASPQATNRCISE